MHGNVRKGPGSQMRATGSTRLGLRIGVVTAVICGSMVAMSGTGHALFHLTSIREIFAGTSTAPNAQFIELQMYSDNQRFLAGHGVAVFDASGTELAEFTFSSPVANGTSQDYILLATTEAEAAFDVSADLVMTPVIPRGGGKVCFRQADGMLIDCAAWGNYTGEDTGTGTPFNSPLGLVLDQSMERVISGGSDPEALDAEDDTDDSEADFDFASPTPTNNAGEAPPVTKHARSITLALRRALVARGRVSAGDDFGACVKDVPVKLQRKVESGWRTIKRTTTGSDGSYKVRLRDRPGRYRAVAPATSPTEEDRCRKAISPTRRNR